MEHINTTEVLGFKVYDASLNDILPIRKLVINTVNQYSYCVAQKDPVFHKALTASDVLLPDGVGITLAARLHQGRIVQKIAGADLHAFALKHLQKNAGSCFYLGASPETLQKITAKVAKEYPRVKVGSYSPPYKPQFSEAESQAMINAVNAFEPDVLFIGMTAPKQEKWSYEFKDQLQAGYICAIGAVFDFYAGTVSRPGKVWQQLGLEWLGRLLKEPKRMFHRYITNGLVFATYLVGRKPKVIS
ncbi:WecB/TagA/CpsF family glycosyltransferase [Croceivirga sp. JEA036]|uniref:WecB/TagA/CpsF family glycosyltransferase n=1 Tax=Croceivirga sp. JEA036 TaxID=2721162 RepID=UPI0014395F51|nr:WecB/TagA/CpsF family glycosyltransferase [Croceivirga sp. JEA036]NJB35399.1 WecB/TagA/CpsF family glycosyltransferase [Croceivirga sp. JEA036]